MARPSDIFVTALAPAIWGSTYLVTTEALPQGYPLTVAMLRALPAGLLLLLVTRSLPPRGWYGRVFLLGAANFAVFWWLLFVAAYRLPGGVAATLGSIQPLIVIGLSRVLLAAPVRLAATLAAIAGVFGVALLVLGPQATLDPIGIVAGFASAGSMALGTVLSRKWHPPVPALTFAAWQLTGGGLLLLPAAILLEPALPSLNATNIAGYAWLGLIGAAASYWLWFRGIARIEPGAVSLLGMMSPLTAVVLGWLWLDQALTPLQLAGGAVVIASVWFGQERKRARERRAAGGPPCPKRGSAAVT